mmetsp:Transcript_2940/g.4239  ORF Transcript_2940/g.4239 Transcript_2940/m.4239 type:complete len:227 (-) Transcript_2940:236-916(-)
MAVVNSVLRIQVGWCFLVKFSTCSNKSFLVFFIQCCLELGIVGLFPSCACVPQNSELPFRINFLPCPWPSTWVFHPIRCDLYVPNGIYKRNNLSAIRFPKPFFCNSPSSNAANSFSSRGSPTTTCRTNPILYLISVVRMSRSRYFTHFFIIPRSYIQVIHGQCDWSTKRPPAFYPRSNSYNICFIPRCSKTTLSRSSPCQLWLHIRFGQLHVGRTPIDHSAHTLTM